MAPGDEPVRELHHPPDSAEPAEMGLNHPYSQRRRPSHGDKRIARTSGVFS
jgi:hypothetical protein